MQLGQDGRALESAAHQYIPCYSSSCFYRCLNLNASHWLSLERRWLGCRHSSSTNSSLSCQTSPCPTHIAAGRHVCHRKACVWSGSGDGPDVRRGKSTEKAADPRCDPSDGLLGSPLGSAPEDERICSARAGTHQHQEPDCCAGQDESGADPMRSRIMAAAGRANAAAGNNALLAQLHAERRHDQLAHTVVLGSQAGDSCWPVRSLPTTVCLKQSVLQGTAEPAGKCFRSISATLWQSHAKLATACCPTRAVFSPIFRTCRTHIGRFCSRCTLRRPDHLLCPDLEHMVSRMTECCSSHGHTRSVHGASA